MLSASRFGKRTKNYYFSKMTYRALADKSFVNQCISRFYQAPIYANLPAKINIIKKKSFIYSRDKN